MTMLCSLLPVKYISAKGNSASVTTRKSDWIPPCNSTLALVSPLAMISRIPGCWLKKSRTFTGFFADASKSMSPMTSRSRRKLPAALVRITSGCERKASRRRSAMGSASLSRWRDA